MLLGHSGAPLPPTPHQGRWNMGEQTIFNQLYIKCSALLTDFSMHWFLPKVSHVNGAVLGEAGELCLEAKKCFALENE